MVRISFVLNMLAYAVSILGFVPVFTYVYLLPKIAFPLAFVVGCYLDRKERHPFSGRLLTLISVAFFVVYAAEFSKSNPSTPVVSFLVILLSIRLLDEKNVRNYFQIFALSLFLLAGSSLFNLSIVFILYLFLLIVSIAVALVLLTFVADDSHAALSVSGLKKLLVVSAVMPAVSVPLIIVYFTILPRTQYPLWNFLNTPEGRVTGFSEKVELGRSASVGEVKSVAFRVETEQLAKNDLYWRGIVLDTFRGDIWVRGEDREDEISHAGEGKRIRQTIYPEPGRSVYLVALNLPIRMDGVRTHQGTDYTYKRKDYDTKRIRYDALSALTDVIDVKNNIHREYYLALPEHVSARTAELARVIKVNGKSDAERVELLERHFRSRKFTYATRNLPVVNDPIDAFLFDRKTGNCEFFASSFAILLRLAGVPSRLVGGYYGGNYNEVGGYYIVTEDMAHVWLEAFVNGRGWIKIDPSSFASGFDRIDEQKEKSVYRKVGAAFDSLTYYWNQAVITYDLEKQVQLVTTTNRQLKKLSISLDIHKLLSFVLLIFVAGASVYAFGKYHTTSREERLLQKFLARVEQVHGKSIHTTGGGLKELAYAVRDPVVDEFVAIYSHVVYKDKMLENGECQRLANLIKNIGQGQRN